ncbi:MAG: hypothetical protein WCF07_15140 [Nitrososphaeraceae archaeon]
MNISEAAYLLHHELNINWTMSFNEMGGNKSNSNNGNSSQLDVEKSTSKQIQLLTGRILASYSYFAA